MISFDVLVPAATAGVLSGAALLLPTLAVAILYGHGRYVPLWLPDLGLLGAYVVHALWTRGIPGTVSAVVAFGATIVLAWLIHRLLIARFLASNDYLRPLLIGLGLSQMFQAVASYYGEGMSQHYPASFWTGQFYSKTLGTAIYWIDIAFVVLGLLAMLALHLYLCHTIGGYRIRMRIGNPEKAEITLGPRRVRTIDCIVLATAAVLVTAGVIMRGIRYDLQPTMMFYPGLGALAAAIVAMPGRRFTAMTVIVLIEIAASIIGTFPAYSPFQRAVPFVVLLLVLAGRAVWQSRRPSPGVI